MPHTAKYFHPPGLPFGACSYWYTTKTQWLTTLFPWPDGAASTPAARCRSGSPAREALFDWGTGVPEPAPLGSGHYIPPMLIGPNLTSQSAFNVSHAVIGVRGRDGLRRPRQAEL